MLQRYGTEAHRDVFGEDFWVTQAMNGLAVTSRIVFTDVRFPNEAAAIDRKGGHVIRLERPGASIAEQYHASEQILQADYVVQNDGTIDDLHRKLDEIMEANGYE
jgi:hypothetical protein